MTISENQKKTKTIQCFVPFLSFEDIMRTASTFHSPWENMFISNRKWVLRSRVLRNRKWHYTGSASQISRAAACLGTPQTDRSLKFVSLTALVHFCSGTQTDHSTALTITTAVRCRHRNLAVSKSFVCKTYRAGYRFEKMLWCCSHLYFMKLLLLPTLRGAELHNWPKNIAEFSVIFPVSYTFICCQMAIFGLLNVVLKNTSCNSACIVYMAVWENPSGITMTGKQPNIMKNHFCLPIFFDTSTLINKKK